jgi:hypothetical protein
MPQSHSGSTERVTAGISTETIKTGERPMAGVEDLLA